MSGLGVPAVAAGLAALIVTTAAARGPARLGTGPAAAAALALLLHLLP